MAEMKKKYSPKLEEASLDVSALTCQCHVWLVPRTQAHAGLITFHGAYRPGSAGHDDALFIRWRIRELSELRLPAPIEGLVVDFCDLSYEYGDDLSVGGNRLYERDLPLLVVVSPSQLDAFRGVVHAQLLRVDLQEAFAEVSDLVRAMQ